MADYRPKMLPPPTRTLGYKVLTWARRNLQQPDGPNTGQPWEFTYDQKRFVLHFYAINDDGTFVNRDATYRGVKGLGKSIFAAALAAIELAGPCRFDRWDSDGKPVAVPVSNAWVDVVATSHAQTKNTFAALRNMFQPSAFQNLGLSVGQTIMRTAAGGTAQSVTSSPLALEGGRTTFAVMEETANWFKANQGHAMAQVMQRNAAKSRGGASRTVQVTNAHELGRDSIAEQSMVAYQAVLDGRSKATGQLYWAWEPTPGYRVEDRASLRKALEEVYEDTIIERGGWINLDRIVTEIYDGRTPLDVSLRYYLNTPTAAADGLVNPDEWKSCACEALSPLSPGDEIVLGFDGSMRDDATALVALRLSDRAFFLIGIQEKPSGPQGDTWVVDRAYFRDLVEATFVAYDVRAFAADVHPFETEIEQWDELYSDQLLVKMSTHSAIGCDMRGNQAKIVKASDALVESIRQRDIKHTGDGILERHVLNARRRPNRYGFSFGKSSPDSQDKIDAYAAMVLAAHARSELLARGDVHEEPANLIVWR